MASITMEFAVAYKLAQESNDVDLFDPTAGTLKCAVLSSVPDYQLDTVKHWSDVSGSEVTPGAGYTGPFLVANPAIAQIVSTGNIRMTGDNMVIPEDAGGFTNGEAIVFFNDTGTPASSLIMLIGDASVTFGNTFGPVNLNVHANGYWDR